MQKIRVLVLPGIERQGQIEAWIVDDTGFTKKGTHSVGIARQYFGRLGKQDNCQVAVTLSIANHLASLPIAYRLYLPETWENDAARRKKTHVPKDIRFKTKPQIALDQIRAAGAEGVAPGIVLADAGYGANSDFHAGVSALNLPYVVGTSNRRPACSRQVRCICLPSRGVAAADALATCSATTNTSLSRSKTWL